MYVLYLSYNGFKKHGWQIQKDVDTFQQDLKNAFIKIYKSETIPNPTGCSRTDANVHALEYIATMKALRDIPPESLKKGLNSLLPSEIRIKKVEKKIGFLDARKLVVGKHYRYFIFKKNVLPPFIFPYVWHSIWNLEIEKMKKAALFFKGTHDFASFQATGSNISTTTRTIFDIQVRNDENFVVLDVKGTGFLKHMIRIIAGTIVAVGKNKIKVDDIPKIIKAKNRNLAGPTLPGKGLFLTKLFKDENEIKNYNFPPIDFFEFMKQSLN